MSQKHIQFGKPLIGKNEKLNVTYVLSGSQFVHGEYAKSFEFETPQSPVTVVVII